MIKLCTLGSLDLQGPEGQELRSVLSQPRRLALLAYLAVATPRGFHRRDTLLGLFWPEQDEGSARHALNQALYALRQSLGERVVLSRGAEEVGLSWEAFWCDVKTFDEAVESGDPEAALELYGGDLLKGFFVSGAPEFEKWLEGVRVRLREQAARAAWAVAHQHIEAEQPTDAEQTAQRALALVPTNESEVRRFVQALAEAGDRAAAVRFYERFARALQDELGLRPAAASRDLVEKIRLSMVVPVVGRTPPMGTGPEVVSTSSRRASEGEGQRAMGGSPEPQFNGLRRALADRYAIEREIGSGGMAMVYLAEDLKHHRHVAIKVLNPDLAAAVGAERFLREIEIAANLTHPHILPVHDSGEADGSLYFVMPYVEGESLRDRPSREKKLPVDDVIRLAREGGDALAHAHERGSFTGASKSQLLGIDAAPGAGQYRR
jgi:serine/threonine-protein kinase